MMVRRVQILGALCWLGALLVSVSAADAIKLQSSAALATSGNPELRAIAVRNEVLLRCGRLLSAPASDDVYAALAPRLAELGDDQKTELRAFIEPLPSADNLTFNGKDYAGGSFGFIDAMIGLGGRPIAMDREPPCLLLPLASESQTTLAKRLEKFQTAQANQPLLKAISPPALAASMFADGQFLRPYCGRFDDLYFHLFQNGNGLSGIAFWAMTDGLTQRHYTPRSGLSDSADAAALRFDLSDVFSGGGRAAIQAWRTSQNSPPAPVLKGFAYQIVPLLAGRLASAKPGVKIVANSKDVALLLGGRRVLYPTGVPPLFRSPDRFFGEANRWRRRWVANEQRIVLSDADTLYPLPNNEPAAGAPEFPGADEHSAQLFSSSSASDLTWDDPAESKLLADDGGAKKSGEPSVNDPRLASAAKHWLAVISGTAAETATYAKAMTDNDGQLREQEKLRRRAGWVADNLRRTQAALPKDPIDVAQQAVADDLNECGRAEQQAMSEIMKLLRERWLVRDVFERQLRDRLVTQLNGSK